MNREDITKLGCEAILNSMPDIAWLKDKESRFVAVNEAFGKACGMKPEGLVGKTDLDVWPRELADRYRSDDKEVMDSGKRKIIEEPLADKEGIVKWIETIKTPIYNDKGEVIGTTGIARDMTERKQVQERLRETKAELEIRVKVRTAELTKANEELVKEISEHKETKKKLEQSNAELMKSNRILKQMSLTDAHTGLYNYRFLQDVIESEFYRARRYSHPLGAIMLDIDYFKSINDVYGHHFGDLVLKQLARQLKRMVRKYDVVIRMGGEEFIVISPGVDREQVEGLAQRLLDALNLYNFGDDKHTVKLKLSLAVVSYPEDTVSNGMDLVNFANHILSKVKESGGNKVYTADDLKNGKTEKHGKRNESANIKQLKGKIEKLNQKANENLIEAIFAFAKTIELKDHYTGSHVEKTVQFATELGKALELPGEEIELIKEASMLHDLGKIGVSENILLKKGKLTKKEFEEIQRHPQIGADIIRPIQVLHGLIPFILYHHERWDGKGYPEGIRGEEIPIGARVIAIADVYQALISDRPYRKAFTKPEAVKLIKAGSGTQFDPRIVDVFLKMLHKKRK